MPSRNHREKTERWPSRPDAGAWIEVGRWDKGVRVRDMVPSTFPAYLRLFHPVQTDGGPAVPWAVEAMHRGLEMHPQIQLSEILAVKLDVFGRPTRGGGSAHQLPRLWWHKLGPILRDHTESDSFFVGICDSRGWMPEPARHHQLLELPHRHYFHAEIPFDEWHSTEIVRPFGADLVWPADRAWLVSSDLDSTSTYLGGTPELVADVLENPEIEALPADPDDRVEFA